MPPGRIQITGLSEREILLIKDAAHYSRKTVRAFVLDHAASVMTEAQATITRASGASANHRSAT